jgi:hypothetical protein
MFLDRYDISNSFDSFPRIDAQIIFQDNNELTEFLNFLESKNGKRFFNHNEKEKNVEKITKNDTIEETKETKETKETEETEEITTDLFNQLEV